jgi:hypothetical protein
LTLTLENDALLPKLAGAPVGNVPQRMNVLAKRYGDRFAEMPLNDFVRGKPKFAETVDLLVLRSTEIDSQLENNPETTLGLIPGTLEADSRLHCTSCAAWAFKEAVIVTDHGFFLNAQAEAGDVCVKPQGNWAMNAHDRMMLGDGSADAQPGGAEKVGIRGDFAQVAMPRSMAPYRSGICTSTAACRWPRPWCRCWWPGWIVPSNRRCQGGSSCQYKNGAKKNHDANAGHRSERGQRRHVLART